MVPCNAPVQARLKTQRDLAQNFEEDELTIAYLERLTEVQTIEELWDLHCRTMANYGFDRLLYGFTRFHTANSFGDRQDWLILSNHDEKYVDRFVNQGMYFHAPMVRWAVENVGACSWSWMAEHADALTDSERQVVEFNQSHGVTSGYSISFKDVSVRAKGAIALTAEAGVPQSEIDDLWARHGREIIVMNNMAHLKIINLPYQGERKNLTRRQREALEWVGDGKTTADIALIMGLTPATVEKHLRLARETLDVETTAQAVFKASIQNQIFVLEAG
ncbi:MAG: LuxR family transcriptional regulator [Halocynthiibacter sp.]